MEKTNFYTHVIQQSQLDALSVVDKAVILQGLSVAGILPAIQKRLSEDVATVCTPAWATQASLKHICMVLHALHGYNAALVRGSLLACAAQRLIESEQTPGGPYHETGEQPDILTNVIVAAFAQWAAGPLPGVQSFIQKHSADEAAQTPLCALYALDVDTFNPQQSSPPEASSVTPVSAAIQLALTRSAQPSSEHQSHAYDEPSNIIVATARTAYATLPEPLRAQANTMTDKIERANKRHEITLLARYFYDAMLKKPADSTLLLGIANVHCWLAYTVYDHILDEADAIALLPLANIAQRKSLHMYHGYATSPIEHAMIEATFNRMDVANAWEIAHARAHVSGETISLPAMPQYGKGLQLASKSCGHILGPILLTLASGYGPDTPQLQAIRNAFWHFLIARQLNDDAHDWQDDLANGQLTLVVSALLADADIASNSTHAVPVLLEQLQGVFREQTSVAIATQIIGHCKKAQVLFAESGLLQPQHELNMLCREMASVAEETIRLQQDTSEMLAHLSKNLN